MLRTSRLSPIAVLALLAALLIAAMPTFSRVASVTSGGMHGMACSAVQGGMRDMQGMHGASPCTHAKQSGTSEQAPAMPLHDGAACSYCLLPATPVPAAFAALALPAVAMPVPRASDTSLRRPSDAFVASLGARGPPDAHSHT